MNTGTFIFGLVVFGAPAAWVLWDSSKRYEKPSWILAALTAITLWSSVAIYIAKRLFKKPVESPAATPKIWQAGVVAASIIGISVAVAVSPESSKQAAQPTRSAPSTPAEPVDHYKRALALAGQGGFKAAIVQLGLISSNHPDFKKAQVKLVEYKNKSAIQEKKAAAEQKARQAEQARQAAVEAEYANLGDNEYITNDGYFAAATEELLGKVTEYSINKDQDALMQMMSTGLVIALKPGLHVYRTGHGGFGVVKIRPKGKTVEIWTVVEAIGRHPER